MEELKLKLIKYKELTEQIYSLIEDNYSVLDEKLRQRQILLDSIDVENVKQAQQIYAELGIDKLDEKVRAKLVRSLEDVKEELKEYQKTKMVNSVYFRNTKEKLNIFSKKV